ncbi:MAG: AMP-binding protein [Methylophilus sp.]|uniref:AMP-binding protein n=1 Tax=Methylophilus sp. TaxID=29541 RepID=UPI003F9EE013
MQPLISLSQLNAQTFPADHIVCIDGTRALTWAECHQRIAEATQYFTAHPARRWMLSLTQPLDFLIAMLALLYANKTVIVPPNTLPGTMQLLSDSCDTTLDALPELESGFTGFELPVLAPEQAKIVFYTSGSSGQPKPVEKTLLQVQLELTTLEQVLGDRFRHVAVVSTVPHQHFYGFTFRLMLPFVLGSTFDNHLCATPDMLMERLRVLPKVVLVSSPAHLLRLPDLLDLSLCQQQISMMLSSGGVLPVDIAMRLSGLLHHAPAEIYGSTETGAIAWRVRQGDDAWRALPGLQVRADADGALLLQSPFAADRHEVRMEDQIEPVSAQQFRLIGRLDRILKVEGKRLSLPEMEQRLTEHPWISHAVISEVSRRRQSVGAVIVLSAEGTQAHAGLSQRASSQLIKQYLAQFYDAVLLPRYWRFVKELPVNDRGKVQFSAVQALFMSTTPH